MGISCTIRLSKDNSHHRSNAIFNASIYHIIVVIDTQLVHWPTAEWQDPRPAQREAVGFDAQGCNPGDVLLVEVVVVVGYVGGEVVHNVVGHTREFVPDGGA